MPNTWIRTALWTAPLLPFSLLALEKIPAAFDSDARYFFILMLASYIYTLHGCQKLLSTSAVETSFIEALSSQTEQTYREDKNASLPKLITHLEQSATLREYRTLDSHKRVIQIIKDFLETRRLSSTISHIKYLSDTKRESMTSETIRIRYASSLIPSLGFLGTVLGISLGISEFSKVIEQEGNVEVLAEVTNSFGMAFSTTFVALALGAVTSGRLAQVDKRIEDVALELDSFFTHILLGKLAAATEDYQASKQQELALATKSQQEQTVQCLTQLAQIMQDFKQAAEPLEKTTESLKEAGKLIETNAEVMASNTGPIERSIANFEGRISANLSTLSKNLSDASDKLEKNLSDDRLKEIIRELRPREDNGAIEDILRETLAHISAISQITRETLANSTLDEVSAQIQQLHSILEKPLAVIIKEKDLTAIVDSISQKITQELNRLAGIEELTDTQQTIFDEINERLVKIHGAFSELHRSSLLRSDLASHLKISVDKLGSQISQINDKVPGDWAIVKASITEEASDRALDSMEGLLGQRRRRD